MLVSTVLRALMHVVNAIGEANRRKAERAIAQIIRRSGGKFTDRVEREVEHSSSRT